MTNIKTLVLENGDIYEGCSVDMTDTEFLQRVNQGKFFILNLNFDGQAVFINPRHIVSYELE